MKKTLATFLGGVTLLVWTVISAHATFVYVDAAPNDGTYDQWWADAKHDIINRSFNDMRSGSNPDNVGTTSFEMEDSVVYSFGDRGSRLTFIYWLPFDTIEGEYGLKAQNFEISMSYIWDGEEYSYTEETTGNVWVEPTKWELVSGPYVNGVIGTAGFAWWGAYGINTQEALEADLADWSQYQGDVIFETRRDHENTYIIANHDPSAPVPEPSTILLMGVGLAGIIGYRARCRV